MRKQLLFETIAFDSHTFSAGSTIPAGASIRYFDRYDDLEDDNVTKEDEEAIVKWLLGSAANDLLFRVLGVSQDSFVACSVKQPVVEDPQKKPGDIDILICPEHRADRAIALQCKAVKVVAFNQEEDDVSKLPDIRGAVLQANKQRKNFGFHRNYLAIIVKADGRKRTHSNTIFRVPNQDTMKLLYEFPQRESLHSDVGILFIDISQPTGKSYDRMAVVGICHDEQAAVLDQSPNLTNRIKELMRQRRIIE
ncbi:MAG TPA: hypothetical protein VF656_03520 [Pyrinomonadaceae bacterium]|jgi:hypothetical protein